MARPRNPDQAAAFAQLREQYPTGALLKVYRTYDNGRNPDWIANPDGGAFHPASWDTVHHELESWLLMHPQCGPGTYKVMVYTTDDNGKPSKAPQFTLQPPRIQSPASIAAAQMPARLAEAQAATQLHTASVVAEAERMQAVLTAEAPRVAAEMEHAMTTQDPAAMAAAQARAESLTAQMKSTAEALSASMQALTAATRGVQALGGSTPVPQQPPAPGVYAGGYMPPPGMAMVNGAPMGLPPQGAPTPTPMGLYVPGFGVIPWSAIPSAGGAAGMFGGFGGAPAAPAAAAPNAEMAALRTRLDEAEKRAAAAEQRAEIEKERARHDAALAQQQRQNEDRFAQAQRDQQAALERQGAELRAQLATLQAQNQTAQQLAARPTDNTMAVMMPLFQQMQAQAQAAQQQMLAVLSSNKNDDASIQVRQAAGAMGEVIQTSMQAVSQMMRMQVAPQGSAQPAWLAMAMRAIDTVGGMGAALLTPTPQPQVIVQQAPAGYGPPPAQGMQPQLPPAQGQAPAQVPQQPQPPSIPSGAAALPAGAPVPQPPPPPGQPPGAPSAPVSSNPQVVEAIKQARTDLAAHRFVSGITALQGAFDLDPELVRVGESYVIATERLLTGYVSPEIIAQLRANVAQYPGMTDLRQPGQPWPTPVADAAAAPPAASSNVIPLNPPPQAQA